MSKTFNCVLCGKSDLSAKSFSTHLRGHKISSRDYYDTHLKHPDEGVCKICGSPASFTNIVKGYGEYCSVRCHTHDPDRNTKILNTKKKLYGEDMTIIYDKQKETVQNWSPERRSQYRENLSNGVTQAIANDPTITTRRLETNIRNGVDFSARFKAVYANRTQEETGATTAKRKQTMLEKYGAETCMQVPEIKEKVISALTTEKRLVAAQKAKATNIANGRILADDDPARDKKKDYKYRVRQISEQWAALSFPAEDLAKRSLNGVEGAVQLDHMVSLEECYRHNIAPEIAGHITNLRIISWEHNISKSRHSSMSVDELLHKYDEYMQKDW